MGGSSRSVATRTTTENFFSPVSSKKGKATVQGIRLVCPAPSEKGMIPSGVTDQRRRASPPAPVPPPVASGGTICSFPLIAWAQGLVSTSVRSCSVWTAGRNAGSTLSCVQKIASIGSAPSMKTGVSPTVTSCGPPISPLRSITR